MPPAQDLMHLRIAVVRGDGAAVVHVLAGRPWPDHSLQLIGDGLRVALRQHIDGAGELAARCAAMLRSRGWDGDEELADSLEARLGTAPTRLLKPLAADLGEVALVLEGDPIHDGGWIELTTGDVWPQSVFEDGVLDIDLDVALDDPDRWLRVPCEGSRAAYRDMEWFIAGLQESEIAARLSMAITGRRAFRRFKDALSQWPDLMARWFAFSEDRQRGRARAWLAVEGYSAILPSERRWPKGDTL